MNTALRSILPSPNTGVVPPHLQPQPKNGGVVPPWLEPKPDTGNGGVVPPNVTGDAGKNGGVVPPHLQPKPGNTGIVPPFIQDRLETSAPASRRMPVLQVPATHLASRGDLFGGVEINPGDFGRCPPGSAGELASTPGGRKIVDAWFNARVSEANAGRDDGSFDVDFFPADNAWQFNFQGAGTWFQFDGNELRVIDTEGERRIPVELPLTPNSLIKALENA